VSVSEDLSPQQQRIADSISAGPGGFLPKAIAKLELLAKKTVIEAISWLNNGKRSESGATKGLPTRVKAFFNNP
jgi:hypothetical protein